MRAALILWTVDAGLNLRLSCGSCLPERQRPRQTHPVRFHLVRNARSLDDVAAVAGAKNKLGSAALY